MFVGLFPSVRARCAIFVKRLSLSFKLSFFIIMSSSAKKQKTTPTSKDASATTTTTNLNGDAAPVEKRRIPLTVLNHPVVRHKLTQLRRAETSSKHFRELVSEITLFLGIEATSDLQTEEVVVRVAQHRQKGMPTPAPRQSSDDDLNRSRADGGDLTEVMMQCTGVGLKTRVTFIPIMRSGLGLVDSMLSIVPMASVNHIGMYNNPDALLPVLYFSKLPAECTSDVAIVLDSQIGTGNTVVAAIDLLKEWAASKRDRATAPLRIKVCSIVASRYGANKLAALHPDVEVIVAAVDDELENGLAVPGIGDPGGRMFNVE